MIWPPLLDNLLRLCEARFIRRGYLESGLRSNPRRVPSLLLSINSASSCMANSLGTELAVIGGGIVGLATAWRWTATFPSRKVVVLEKEPQLAQHQTGRNSGVLHSGIYYKPGSLKAVNCRDGRAAMVEFCRDEGIGYDVCGKVIVAVDERELARLNDIYQRGQANGVRCTLINRDQLRELEPHCAGIQAIHVPDAGIVDYPGVCQRLAQRIREHGGEVITSARVLAMADRGDSVAIQTTAGDVTARYVVNCAGLHCDRVTRLSGQQPPAKIVPFRGEYFELRPSARHLCRNLIYPVPDPKFPFLGVHFTRMIHDSMVECGPNAVLAFAREGYTKTDINFRDLAESLSYVGFWHLAARHWRMGLSEMWRSLSKAAFVKTLQRLVPEIRAEDLEPAPAGVRAMALQTDGSLIDDFLFQETDRVVNVCNAPSPAATAALNIGRLIVNRLAQRPGLQPGPHAA
jgi:(S)-2-hydroxyglutarate dehydrogenase